MTLDQALAASVEAFEVYKTSSGSQKAALLEEIARQIEALGDPLLQTASEESNLPYVRFVGERGRTCGQLRMFASLLREGSWVEASIDTAIPERHPAPKPDLRRMLIPLGPVGIFGASNFPLAFSTAGGDSASALASGCTVVYKGHPAHPKTSLMVAGAISKALELVNLPQGVFIHLEGGIELGQQLALHPDIKAIGFTGSLQGGLALSKLANSRPVPIPVFAEMGSVNPIFISSGKLQPNLSATAKAIVQSVTMGVGQFCTNPGLIFIPAQLADALIEEIKVQMEAVPAFKMLHSGIAASYREKLSKHLQQKGVSLHFMANEEDSLSGIPAVASVDLHEWLQNSHLQEEIFGPFTLLVKYDEKENLMQVPKVLQGQLTCTIWFSDEEAAFTQHFAQSLRENCGRLLFAGVPTGVEVCPSMTHGGPFPSTTHSQSTSVGTGAIKRFTRPFTWQDCPQAFLPEELKNENSLQIWRTVNGSLTKESL